jgi:hypothetical protein
MFNKTLCNFVGVVVGVVLPRVSLAEEPVPCPTTLTLEVNGTTCTAPSQTHACDPVTLHQQQKLEVKATLSSRLPAGVKLEVYRSGGWQLLCDIKETESTTECSGTASIAPATPGMTEVVYAKVANCPLYAGDITVTWVH